MKNLILLLLTGCSSLAQINQMQTVNSIAELQSLNAKTAKTNTFAVYGLVFGDGKGGIWTWKAGDTAATNGVESGGPIASANPLSGTGRWYRVSQPGGGTNYFSTTIVTNLTVISNIVVNNLTVNTNITVSGTNVGTINPTIDYLPVKIGTNAFGDSPVYRIATNVVGVDEIWAYSVSATNLQPGGVVISLPPSGVLTNVPFGVGVLSQDASSNITWSAVAPGSWTNRSGVLQPIDLTLPIGFTNNITFLPGTDHVLRRSGDFLVYTNSSSSAVLKLVNGSDQTAQVGLNGSAQAFLLSPTTILLLQNSGQTIAFINNVFGPNTDGAISLGDFDQHWNNLEMSGTAKVRGFGGSSGTDYSELRVSHSGTNSAAVYNSVGAGTAGIGRPHYFQLDGTNSLKIALTEHTYSDRMTLGLGAGSDDTIFLSTLRGGTYYPIDIKVNNTLFAVTDGAFYLQPAAGTLPTVNAARAKRAIINNTANASLGVTEWSPSLAWRGSGWDTSSSEAKSVTVDALVEPIEAAEPVGILRFYGQVGTGSTKELLGVSTEGPIKIPSLTKAEKTALTAVENGMLVYQTDNTPGLRAYVNGAWVMISTVADP